MRFSALVSLAVLVGGIAVAGPVVEVYDLDPNDPCATATLRHPLVGPVDRRLRAEEGRGFGWAGAGPIRGRLVGDTPTPVLMPRRRRTAGSAPRAWAGERPPGPPATLNGGIDPCANVRSRSQPAHP